MILVDTSIWIDFFKGVESGLVTRLEVSIRNSDNIAINGIILTETLQGIRDEKEYRSVRQHLKPLIMLPMDEPVFIQAAELYRQCRKQGLTIRKTNDCIIAATAIYHQVALLHHGRDFDRIEQVTELETLSP